MASKFKPGDRVQMHGYPGAHTERNRRGFRGTVEGFIGSRILYGVTDDGGRWSEYASALQAEGEPNRSVVACTCCPRSAPKTAPEGGTRK